MSLEAWRESGFVVEHEASRQEISELLEIVDTDLADARIGALSNKRRFACCYSAILNAARAALAASGFRVPKGNPSHHYYAIQSLRHTVELEPTVVQQVEAMGKKRAEGGYVRVGGVSESMANEALAFAEDCCKRIVDCIRVQHPSLMAS
jgi:hypothetical protein